MCARPLTDHALKKAGIAVHVLRLLGLQPEANPRRVPQSKFEIYREQDRIAATIWRR